MKEAYYVRPKIASFLLRRCQEVFDDVPRYNRELNVELSTKNKLHTINISLR